MTFEYWCTLVGFLLLGMALIPNRLGSWPITTSQIYLGIGILFGPMILNSIHLSPFENEVLLERLSEVAVLVSLFTAGLKLRLPFSDGKWQIPLRLAFISMSANVGMVTLIGVYGLKLEVGAAVLLGAILSPTDPVLASDVQVENTDDDDRLRFSLTGEAGFNDGTAFPFVMLGLGLLGQHDLGVFAWRWVAIDVLWSILAGAAIGAALGFLVARIVIYLRAHRKEAVGTDDFLALGLIAGAYGIALFFHSYGFLSVFAAGLALRHTERIYSDKQAVETPPEEKTRQIDLPHGDEQINDFRKKVATNPERAASFMAREMLHFNESLERIAELGLVMLLGGMLSRETWTNQALWLAPLLFLVVRPLSIGIGLWGAPKVTRARPYLAWFGIRGIGSIYYLFYATQHGISAELSRTLIQITFSIITLSILAHGLTVTPLMKIYNRDKGETAPNP